MKSIFEFKLKKIFGVFALLNIFLFLIVKSRINFPMKGWFFLIVNLLLLVKLLYPPFIMRLDFLSNKLRISSLKFGFVSTSEIVYSDISYKYKMELVGKVTKKNVIRLYHKSVLIGVFEPTFSGWEENDINNILMNLQNKQCREVDNLS